MTVKFYGFDRSLLHDTTDADPFVIDMVRAEDFVKFEAEVARLNEQVQALAAENAARKNGNGSAIEFADFYAWWNVFNQDGLHTETERMLAAGAWMARSGLGNTDTYQYVAPKPLAADAILNEVRAQAVEGFAAKMQEWGDHWEKNGVRDGSASRCFMVADDAREYAVRIRAGEVGP